MDLYSVCANKTKGLCKCEHVQSVLVRRAASEFYEEYLNCKDSFHCIGQKRKPDSKVSKHTANRQICQRHAGSDCSVLQYSLHNIQFSNYSQKPQTQVSVP